VIKNIILLLFFLIGVNIYSQTINDAKTDLQDLITLNQKLETLRQNNNVSAMQVALILTDTTVFWNFGEIKPGVPVTDSTMFHVASISKTFAGLSMLKLVEQGKVSLEDNLKELAPELSIRNPWRKTHPVKVTHLLQAGAGFVGFHPDLEKIVDSVIIDLNSYIESQPYRLDVQWRPGEYTSYHNFGPVITAYLVEKISGQKYADFVDQYFFQPLEMKHSSFFETATVKRRIAGEEGYRNIGGAWPSGGLVTSAKEFQALIQMLLNQGIYKEKRIITSKSIRLFETPSSTLASRKSDISLGHAINNWTTTFRGFDYRGHGGNISPYQAYYLYSPTTNIGLVFMGMRGSNNEALHYPVIEAVLDYFHPNEKFPVKYATGKDYDSLAGCYVLENPGSLKQDLFQARITAVNGIMMMDEEWNLELTARPNVFRIRNEKENPKKGRPDDMLVMFIHNDEGELIMQNLDHRHEALVRIPCISEN